MQYSTNLHPTVATIRELLETHKMPYEFYEHDAVRTSEEAAAQRPEYSLSQGAKALIVKYYGRGDVPDGFAMIVVPGDKSFDTKKARQVLKAKKIRFANQAESDELTDRIAFGGVPPWGNLFGIPVYVDRSVFNNETIIFNCGDKRASIAMKAKDWSQLVQPVLAEIV